ncbi:MAG: gliding motility-associated ABC transporter substrate-binding protein GldG [Bacteroidetes bacterium]|nr:gliding motility-associated ABC transporter substrate-binding protein GldG [Bacteroidota bacterium]
MKFRIKNVRRFQEPLILFICILFLLIISHDFYFRIDLTSDKRYSLNKHTKMFLKNINEEINIEIYLEGDLPINFKKFRNSIEEKLMEFRILNDYINYKFVDVSKLSINERKALFKKLKKEKIYATNIFIRDRGKKIEKIVFPIAKISTDNNDVYIKLFKNQGNLPIQILTNKAIESLEYNFISTISNLTNKNVKQIGILVGCGQPSKKRLYMISKALKKTYNVNYVNIKKSKNFDLYDALILIRPTKPFSEEQKYILDQYIMNGGKVLFFINSVNVDMKNLQKGLEFAFPNNINLSDMLFRYGIRVNKDLIEDINCLYYPIVVSEENKNIKMDWLRWPLFPILDNFSDHIITKKLNSISTRFVSSIDIIKNQNVNKIPLIYSSYNSIRKSFPIKIDINDLRKQLDPKDFNQGPFPVACLLEGNFKSYFKNKYIPENFNKKEFKEKSKFTQLLVVSSGNFLRNDIDPKTKIPVELGYDYYFNHVFSQKEFILNVLDYMLNKSGLIYSKNKDIKLRLLNLKKINGHFLKWQLINIITPILILLIWALIWNYLYRRKNLK